MHSRYYYQAMPCPHFSCAIQDGTVSINTQYIPDLQVDLGPSGLQMTGDVQIILNGKPVYSGPVPSQSLNFKP